ncbi:MAG: hypothetical protein MRK02_10050 [Candidatus Scalindua sp.]|nr:hypothetical protein [Candidatus Scalindua sp.]
MSRHIAKAFLLLSIILLTSNSEAADNDLVQKLPINSGISPYGGNIPRGEYKENKPINSFSELTVKVPVYKNGSLSEVRWQGNDTTENLDAFLSDQKEGDGKWHGIINNTAKGTWSNFNNEKARMAIIQLLDSDAARLSDLTVLQVEFDKDISADGKSAMLTFKSARIIKQGVGGYQFISGYD